MLLQLRADTPVVGSDTFFNKCVKNRGSLAGRAESSVDCECFGWGEDGFDAASNDNPLAVLQSFNPHGPWRDIPCYQRRATDGTEWMHPVDKKTCREVSTKLLSNHHLCDWEYAGYSCECHGLDLRFHANPESPWFVETFDEQCSDAAIVADDDPVREETFEITRLPGDNSKAWIRLDLQFSAVIDQVRLDFDNTRQDDAGKILLWNTLKHYEIQIGDNDRLDANPVYAQYQIGDETTMQCTDCEAILASVDPELLM